MFDHLSRRLRNSLKDLRGKGRITEKNIHEAIREIRLSLLEADVHFKVVKALIERVKEKALGSKIIGSLSADQQFFHIVYDELLRILGGAERVPLHLKGKPAVVFLVGLQGMGKTTSAAKLAWFVRKTIKKKPALVSVDIYRPAAMEQLEILSKKHDLPFYAPPDSLKGKPEEILKSALNWASQNMVEVLCVDTAGRLQVDQELMEELKILESLADPKEILLVVDAMLGQEVVNVAKGFQKAIDLTGVFLTKIEGDARGGGAISLREATGLPIKFFGIGEGLTALEVFYPDRLVSRILDQGDILSLVEKAKEVLSEEEVKESRKKMQQRGFTMEGLLKQIQMMRKMGGMANILKMLPGMKDKLGQVMVSEKEIKKMEAIVFSMTLKERADARILNASRRLRIAKGSGTKVQDINKLVRQFEEAKKMMSRFKNKKASFPSFPF